MCPYASCNDCCIVHSTGAGADPELVSGGGGWSCMMFLHPVPTCADVGPDLCTLCLWWLSPTATYGGGVSPSAIGTKTPLAPAIVSPITYIDTGLTLGQLIYTVWWCFLAVVVVDVCVCGHGGCT